jgi:hypothetical protein
MVHWMGQEYQMAVKLVGPDTAKQRNSKGRTRNVWSAAELQGQREEIVGIRRQMSAAWLYLGGSIRPAGSASLFTVPSAISASF